MEESFSKHPFNFLKAKRVEEHGDHLDKENAKVLDKYNSKSECGDQEEGRTTRYCHQGSKTRKSSAVTTGDKLRRNSEEGDRSALELNLEIRTSKRRNPMGKKLQ